jgi:hypothetical protein
MEFSSHRPKIVSPLTQRSRQRITGLDFARDEREAQGQDANNRDNTDGDERSAKPDPHPSLAISLMVLLTS